MTRTSFVGRLAALAVTAMVAAGCGGETAPTESAPELAEQLERVDQAVVAGDDARIRNRVESLMAATESARDDGRLDDEQADRILAAGEAMLARLPAEEPAPEPSPPSSSPTTETPEPPEEDEDDEGDEGDNSGPGGGGSEEKPEKDKPEKPDEGKGHGKG
jgi:hypothetical protein